MKIIDKSINFIDRLVNTIIIIILIIALLISCYAIYDTFATYENAELSDDILKYRPMNNGNKFSLESLQKDINEDICGWIRINDTNIDYPVLYGEDNSVYLNLNYKKEYSLTGSIYIDYRNNRDFEDDFNIIYGHNLKADLMFAEVKNYEKKEYFETHKEGLIYANDKIYKLELFSYGNLSAYSSLYNLLINGNDNNSKILSEFEKISSISLDLDVKSTDKLVMLSTCNAAGSEDRAVLLGRLVEIDGESININENQDISLETIDKQLEEKDRALGQNYNTNNVEEDTNESDGWDWLRYVIVFIGIIVIIIEIYIYNKKKDEKEEEKIEEYNKVFYSSYNNKENSKETSKEKTKEINKQDNSNYKSSSRKKVNENKGKRSKVKTSLSKEEKEKRKQKRNNTKRRMDKYR